MLRTADLLAPPSGTLSLRFNSSDFSSDWEPAIGVHWHLPGRDSHPQVMPSFAGRTLISEAPV